MTDVAVAPDHTPCRVGIWGVFNVEDYGQAVYLAVLRAELARRLPAAQLRIFAPTSRPTRSHRGEPVEVLGPRSPTRVGDLADQLDFVLVTGWSVGPDSDPFLVEGLGARIPTTWHATDRAEADAMRHAGVEGSVDVTPHPAVLLPRLMPAPVLEKRREYLRVMGWYPRESHALVIQGGPAIAADLASLLPQVRQVLDDHPGLAPVLAELHQDDETFARPVAESLRGWGRVYRIPASASAEDVSAAVAAATAFVGSSPTGQLTALAHGRPAVPLISGAGKGQALPEAFARAVKAGAGEATLVQVQTEVDSYIDRIARAAAATSRARHPDGLPDPTRPALEAELQALRLAHRARVERSYAERTVLADHVARAEAEVTAFREEVDRLAQRAGEEADARARAEAECAALRNTRTFRWTSSARSLYRALRGRRL